MDGTVLSAHQVDALSGTLIALTAELLVPRGKSGNGNGSAPPSEELPSGEVELEGDELADEEPLDWDPAEEAEEEAASDSVLEDPGASRRFWFEHATGAGKTVAALGFAEASRTGGVLILTHRRNLVDQFLGELRDRGYRDRISAPAASQERRRAARRRTRDRRDLPVVRAQRRQDLGRVHDRHLRRGAHGARREDQRLDPPVDRPGVHRHDGHRRADRAPRDRPLPHADLALRPGPGGPARRDRAAALRAHPAGRGRALDRQRAAAPRRGGPGLRPGRAGGAARPDALQPGGGRPLQDALQGRSRTSSTPPGSSTRTTWPRRSRTRA